MRVFAVSDLHVDHKANRQWINEISQYDFQDDLLIVAGDLTDNLVLLSESFSQLASRFKQVLFVPGNHDCWVIRDKIQTSFEKFNKVLEVCAEHNITTDVYHIGNLSIVPLFSWYDFSFSEPCEKLQASWSDFFSCKWPEKHSMGDIANVFFNMNTDRLTISNETIISFTHFLPRIEILPSFIPESFRFLHPVMGSTKLGQQVDTLNPHIHIYGHSHVNWNVELDGVRYINNAFGYPAESRITRKALLCVYEVK